MRTREEVLDKFHEMRSRYLSERSVKFLGKTPMNCIHNHRMRLKGQGKVGFCCCPNVLNPMSRSIFVCDDEDTSALCRHFLCRNTPESVRVDFDEVLRSPARCGNEYPKLAMLIWFLQEFKSEGWLLRLLGALGEVRRSISNLVLMKWVR